MRVPIPVVGGEYESRAHPISSQRTVNCFPEIGQDGANATSIVSAPGTVLSASNPNIRGMTTAFNQRYYVAGDTLYRNDVAIGSVGDDGKPVSMIWNIFELLIASGGIAYVHQKDSTAVAATVDPDFPTIMKAGFLDGYAVLIEPDSGRVWVTTNNDFETIDGADFATAEGLPDENVSMLIDHREVWLFQEESAEIWYNQGGADFPLARNPNGFIERGCTGTFSPAKLDNTVYWLGDDLVVYKADGFTPRRVSNHGIEHIIADAPLPSEAVGMAYNQEGHAFYQLHFPGHATVLYDASTQVWHSRRVYGRDDSAYYHHMLHNGTHYVGGDNVYTLNLDNFQHNGGEMERIKSFRAPNQQGRFTTYNRLAFLFERGNTPTISQKKAFIRISPDFGATWTERIEANIGTRGERQGVLEFWALGGYFDEPEFELTVTDNAGFNIVEAWADVS